MKGQYFRAGVGAVIANDQGHVLALERADIPGAWQLPQGGLDESEEPFAAILREIAEETGIREDQLELVRQHHELLAYELPLEARSVKTGRGQVQYWFLFRYRGRDMEIQLPQGGEFRASAWLPFDEIVADVVGFRKPVYRRLKEFLGSDLAGESR